MPGVWADTPMLKTSFARKRSLFYIENVILEKVTMRVQNCWMACLNETNMLYNRWLHFVMVNCVQLKHLFGLDVLKQVGRRRDDVPRTRATLLVNKDADYGLARAYMFAIYLRICLVTAVTY